LGIYANFSLIICRETDKGTKVIEVGFPLFIGCLTAMNQFGLCLAMNTCRGETDYIEGMPAVFYNRLCVESCPTIKEVKKFVQKHTPLGPFNLTVADEDNAASIHLFQGSGKDRHYIRDWNPDEPLFTTNLRYGVKGPTRANAISNNRERISQFDQYIESLRKNLTFENRNPEDIVSEVLRLPEINNSETLHTIEMYPKTRLMKIARDNGWAGCQPFYKVPCQEWLS
jgi:hypothetical protein